MLKLDSKEELAIGSQREMENWDTCESVACIPMKISTPISLKPCIKKLPITAYISGEPVLEQTSCKSFILTQELCVKVAIEITIGASIGNAPPLCRKLPIGNCPEGSKYKTNPNVVIGK